MEHIDIDSFILSIPSDEIIIIEKENPPADQVFMPFVENSKLNAVKYTIRSKNIYDSMTKKYYFEFPRYCTDIVTNIRCDDNVLVINKKEINCNIQNLSLPIFNMTYVISKLESYFNDYIIYDAYLLSDQLRNQIRKKRLINNENLMFFAGGCYQI